MNSLLFSLIGTPVIYYGDELGMGDNIYLGDRNGVRTPMQWSSDRNAGFSRSNPQALYLPPIIDPEYHYETVNVEAQSGNPHSLLWWTKQLISLRKRFAAFGYGTTEFLVSDNRKVLIFFRQYEDELLLIVSNLSRFAQYVELDLSKHAGSYLVELFSGQRFPRLGELPYFLTLGPYGYYWFALEKEAQEFTFDRESRLKVDEMNVRQDEKVVFDKRHRQQFETALFRYLRKKPWFAPLLPFVDRSRLRIEDVFQFDGLHFAILQIGFTDGVIRRFPLYLSFEQGEVPQEWTVLKINNLSDQKKSCSLVDKGESAFISQTFAKLISEKKKLKGETGVVRGVPIGKDHVPVPSLIGQESAIACREAGSILFPFKEGVLKVFTEIEEGMNLDVEMRLFLTHKTQFRSFLPILGYVEYCDHTVVALAEEVAYYQSRFSAEERAIESAERFLIEMESKEQLPPELSHPKMGWMQLTELEIPEPVNAVLESYLEDARMLGEMTAQLHQALQEHPEIPDFSQQPFTRFYQRSFYQTLRKKLAEAMGHLRVVQKLVGDVEDIVALQGEILKALEPLSTRKFVANRQRCHGHFKLPALFCTGKEFLVANFEGRPYYTYAERRYKRSPLTDIASMIFSYMETALVAIQKLHMRGELGDVAHEQLREKAHAWAVWVGSSFFRSYLHKSTATLPKEESEYLLLLYVIENCLEKITLEGKSRDYKVEAAVTMLRHVVPILLECKL